MPIYEYKCLDCGKVSEFLFYSDQTAPEILCSSCRSRNLEKIFSVSSINVRQSALEGTTCCGSTERCEQPPCSDEGVCRKE